MQQEKTDVKVSVILPVYNPGEMISKCIESIRGQTLKEIEIIFVDDLGTDGAMQEIRQAATEDSRIKILTNQENSGAGFSRNRGIEIAIGEYLSFIDPDDYIAPDFLELLYNKAKETGADIVKGVRMPVLEDGSFAKPSNVNAFVTANCINEKKSVYLYFSKEHQTAIYKREMVMQNGARYGSSRKKQDQTFLLKVTSQTKKIAIENNAIYYFCERANSAVHTINYAHLEATVLSLKERIDYVIEKLSKDAYIIPYTKNLLNQIFTDIQYAETFPELKPHISFFESQIKEQIQRIPFLEELEKASMSVKICMDKNIFLPTIVRKLDWQGSNYEAYHNLINRWIQFYLANPNYFPDRIIYWIKEISSIALKFGKEQTDEKVVRKKINKWLIPLGWKNRRKIMKQI